MGNYVVLLRGINVGGHKIIKMAELTTLLQSAGFTQVKTYIQSGNLVLQSDSHPSKSIHKLIYEQYSFTVDVLAILAADFLTMVAENPYPSFDGKYVHLFFCQTAPQLDTVKLQQLKTQSEQVSLAGQVLYLHAPQGVARSKLMAKAEQCLGCTATARNLNTVNKLASMLAAIRH